MLCWLYAAMLKILSCAASFGFCRYGHPNRWQHLVMQGRFAGHVFPGETLEVQMWRTASSTVTFQVLVKERGKVALSNAAVIFKPGYCEQPPAMSRL